MIDWNGNRRIDPADIAVSIALEQAAEESEADGDEELDGPVLPAVPAQKPSLFSRLFRRS